MVHVRGCILTIIAVGVLADPSSGAGPRVPAFPGAEGAGAATPGGRGGAVHIVTSLADSGPGSLRAAVEAEGPRTVVFGVAGLITLEKPLDIQHPFLTLAGQTAPGDGVCIRGESVHINTHDVIVRYLRFRRGNLQVRDDALGGFPVADIIVDHVSASWGLDENLSLYRWIKEEGGKQLKMPLERVTIQWSITSEALNRYQPRLRRDLGGKPLLVPPQPVRLQHRPEPKHRHEWGFRLPQQRHLQLGPPHGRRRRRQLPGEPREQLLQARPGHRGRPPPPDRQDAGPMAGRRPPGLREVVYRGEPRRRRSAGHRQQLGRRDLLQPGREGEDHGRRPRPPRPRSVPESSSPTLWSSPSPPSPPTSMSWPTPAPRSPAATPSTSGSSRWSVRADRPSRTGSSTIRPRSAAGLNTKRPRPRSTPTATACPTPGSGPTVSTRPTRPTFPRTATATAIPRSRNTSTVPTRPSSSTTPGRRTTGAASASAPGPEARR